MPIGYSRLSTAQQNLDLPANALNRADCEQLFTDTAGGARAGRQPRPIFDAGGVGWRDTRR